MKVELKEMTVEYLRHLRESGQHDITLSEATWEALQRFSARSPAVSVFPKAEERRSPSSNSGATSTQAARVELPRYGSALSVEEKIQALQKLASEVEQCPESAALFRRRKKMVFGSGSPEAAILFVGEAPGADEDEQGEPFVGEAGRLLTKMIEVMGLKRGEVYLCNVLKFIPDMPRGSATLRKPTAEEVAVSRPYLLAQIEIIRPQVIVCLGGTALEALLNVAKGEQARMRGCWMSYQDIPLLPTVHPTYLLNHSTMEEKRRVWEDLLGVMEKVNLPISEKQRGFFLKK
jgi:uracil-DNA glycosylase